MWDWTSHRANMDLSCGASARIWRLLAAPPPPAGPGAGDSRAAEEEPIPQDPGLAARDMADLLDPQLLPPPLALVHQGGLPACGFMYARGAFRLWANGECAKRLFSTEEANARYGQMCTLPCYLFSRCVTRPSYLRRFVCVDLPVLFCVHIYILAPFAPRPRSPNPHPRARHHHRNSVVIPSQREEFLAKLFDYMLSAPLGGGGEEEDDATGGGLEHFCTVRFVLRPLFLLACCMIVVLLVSLYSS